MDNGAIAWKEKGNAYYKQKRYEEALRCYSEAVQADPLYADAWYNLGMTCRALGYTDESVTCFKRAEKYGIKSGSGNSPAARIPSSLQSDTPTVRSGLHDTTDTRHNDPSGRDKKNSVKILASFIIVLLILFLMVAAIIPVVTQTNFAGILPINNGGITDSRSSSGQAGQVIAKDPNSGYSVRPSVSPSDSSIPNQYLALKTGAVSKSFPFVLRGNHDTINLTMYQGVAREIAKEDPYSYVGKKDRYQKFIDLPEQEPFLDPVVEAIREKSDSPDDQVRIAVSLVQQIPYDQEMLDAGTLEIRYPYQTLLDNEGVCCEKSVLLAYILHKLGYGVALFDFETEKHTAVGIRVAPDYDYKNTGYAFIETTTPLIISDGNGEYPAFGRIRSPPEVLPAGDGIPFSSVSEEWNDAREWDRLNSLGPVLDRQDYSRWQALCHKYGIVPGNA
jgi:tetratricopeptide (TPR) repeat protein